MVLAIAGPPGTHVDLVESNRRKCAFLRTAIRETGAAATVHEGRVETILAGWSEPTDRVSARALASLKELFVLAEPVMGQGVPAAFHKGQGYRQEIAEASQSFAFDLVEHESRVEGGGVILEVANLRRTGEEARKRP
jgi:16S rRNA (guanine527-N7)-methyltransferase